jgi:hypothetical protein
MNLALDIVENNEYYFGDVELNGAADSWVAEARIFGRPGFDKLHITYRLGDFLTPIFVSETHLRFFAPLMNKIADHAELLLPKKF